MRVVQGGDDGQRAGDGEGVEVGEGEPVFSVQWGGRTRFGLGTDN